MEPGNLQDQIKMAAFSLGPKIKRYDFDEIQKILDSGFPIDYPVTDTKMPALTAICSLKDNTSQHQEVNADFLRFIFHYNPDINAKDAYNRTPLHLACKSGNLTACTFLFQVGGLSKSTDTDGDVQMGDQQPRELEIN